MKVNKVIGPNICMCNSNYTTVKFNIKPSTSYSSQEPSLLTAVQG